MSPEEIRQAHRRRSPKAKRRDFGSKLTRGEVQDARRLCSEGVECTVLAESYEVPYETMHAALTGKTWRDVGGALPNLGRAAKAGGLGCIPANARLTQEKADEIRAAYQGGVSYADLGRAWGVSRGTIGSIIRNETWTRS